MSNRGFKLFLLHVFLLCFGTWFGYQLPRDVEIESTKPIEFRYEVTPEAAKYLVQKAFAGCPTSAD
ncbi:hypothetical protein D3C81_1689380 [compost metagenome]